MHHLPLTFNANFKGMQKLSQGFSEEKNMQL